jgi:hypothetical protein
MSESVSSSVVLFRPCSSRCVVNMAAKDQSRFDPPRGRNFSGTPWTAERFPGFHYQARTGESVMYLTLRIE